jgi:hypothetical protein
MSEPETAKYINIFQRIQADSNSKGFDPKSLNEKDIHLYDIKPVPAFTDLPYVKEFTLLNQINDGIDLSFPIKYPSKTEKEKEDGSKEMKGFKWFMEEKEEVGQRLFHPHLLTEAVSENVAAKIPLNNWGQECKK